MSKEQLEEIKQIKEEASRHFRNADTFNFLFMLRKLYKDRHIDYLIEQAERAHELENEYQVRQIEYFEEHIDRLEKENKRYREALEFYADRDNYKLEHFDPNLDDYMSTVDYDEGAEARKALEGEGMSEEVYRDAYIKVQKDRNRLIEQNNRYREALEFYADKDEYYARINFFNYDKSRYGKVYLDEGRIARKTLEGEE